jgi:acyl-CoA thioesterase FadM
MSLVELPVSLPRHAFAPGELARAGDVWRLLQEVAIQGSSALGWTAERYREANAAFVVRAMTVVHPTPIRFGDPLHATTWVSRMRRDMFTDREIRVHGPRGLCAATTQGWVHVTPPTLAPSRACAELVEALVVLERDPSVRLPDFEATEGPEESFTFPVWHTWMDPLGHANHPAYVDWVDEALSQRMAAAGLDPCSLQPIAEQITFRSGVVAPETLTVHTRLVGTVATAHGEPDAVIAMRIVADDARICADGTFIRRGVLPVLR